ncbi:MAG TPA: acetoacetate--CoA ligase [Saprospiraceae bacterium]|nr:acetoacetate--CoA ligase [Saprospiraceae bacterium]
MREVLWKPSKEFMQNSHMFVFMQWVNTKYKKSFQDYDDLWQWSVNEKEQFWEAVWNYFDIDYEGDYEKVVSGGQMPNQKWFEGTKLNYAAHIFRQSNDNEPAIIYKCENNQKRELSWRDLREQVARLQAYLKEQGVDQGDYVAGYLANSPHASIAFLATVGLGAVWSCCSPDFGVDSVVDRFEQLKPKVLLAIDGYVYNEKIYDKRKEVRAIRDKIPSIKSLIWARNINSAASCEEGECFWEEALDNQQTEVLTRRVPFDHPLWVLYSSGTTGQPKAIVHSHGGNLLEHLKYHAFHNNTKRGERFFWYTTTGWMMWNYLHASWLLGATVVLYDGSPSLSKLDVLWEYASEAGIHHFGTSAPFLVSCMKRGVRPSRHDLSALVSIGSTGAPLPPEAFDYVYSQIKRDVWLCSMSGGTDVCTAFVGGNPLLPVRRGEIQCRALGCALYAWDENGEEVIGDMGEMVITEPMPSMPVRFLNDPGNKRYLDSYFDMYPGIWRHGDWVEIEPHGGLVILGRSDATLNRHGIRIGTAEIYNVLNKIEELKDSLIVNLEKENGDHFMPLFVVTKNGLTPELVKKIKLELRKQCSPRHVPDVIEETQQIPRTISGKKMEAPVKKILMGRPLEKSINLDAMQNPESVDFFVHYAGSLSA